MKMRVSTQFFKGTLEKNADKTTYYYIVPASCLDSTAVVISDIEKDSYRTNYNDVIVMRQLAMNGNIGLMIWTEINCNFYLKNEISFENIALTRHKIYDNDQFKIEKNKS